jgi:hypothetical protein
LAKRNAMQCRHLRREIFLKAGSFQEGEKRLVDL